MIPAPGYLTLCLAINEVSYCYQLLFEYIKILKNRVHNVHELVLQSTLLQGTPQLVASNFVGTIDSLLDKSVQWKKGLDELELRLVLTPVDFELGEPMLLRGLHHSRAWRFGARGQELRKVADQPAKDVGMFEHTPDDTPEDTSEETSEQTPEYTPENTSEETSEDASVWPA